MSHIEHFSSTFCLVQHVEHIQSVINGDNEDNLFMNMFVHHVTDNKKYLS